MKFKLETTINKPRSEVWRIFTTPENMNKWQSSLVSIELISGEPGQPGAVSRLKFEEGGREFSLTEKITQRLENQQLDVIYENEFTDNPARNIFIEQSEHKTLWRIETEYKFKTFAMKLLGPFTKKNFVRRTQKDMERFKELAEGAHEV